MRDQIERPDFERKALYAWQLGYLPANRAFADAVIEEARGSVDAVLINDYHLYAVPPYIRSRYPEAFLQHFIHIPWPGPEEWKLLPRPVSEAIVRGLLSNDSVVFQTEENVSNFLDTCSCLLPEAEVDFLGGEVMYRGQRTRAWSNPVSVDATSIERQLASNEAARLRAELETELGEQTIVRVDRLDPSKNIDAGFRAFRTLLEGHPELRGRVRFLAFLVPSRTDLPNYRAYADQVFATVNSINAQFGTDEWQPVKVYHEPNRLRALVAMSLYDVLLVNSHADGMNLVAKEGSLVNGRNGALLLSNTVGAYEELECGALGLDPEDVAGTAAAMYRALTMAASERRERAALLRRAVLRHQLDDWLALLLRDMVRPISAGIHLKVVPSPAVETIGTVGDLTR
jgi:trehalose 6-phosphate synthase